MGRVPGTCGKASVLEGMQVPLAAGRPRGTWVLSGNEECVKVGLRQREEVEGPEMS